jgi:hypothetical protein
MASAAGREIDVGAPQICKAELVRFFATMATRDFAAPATGAHDLHELYRGLARHHRAGGAP